jgi:hypothetical protein
MSLLGSVIQSASRGLNFRASEAWPGRYTIDQVASMFRIGEVLPNFTLQPFKETIQGDYVGLVDAAYRGNAIVFACELVRFSLFSEARFQFQQLRQGRPGDLFGNSDLGILEKPEPGKTTGDLLGRALLDADFSGSWYGVRRPGRIKRLRPDWTAILMGSPNRAVELPAHDPDIEVIGYAYWPGGQWSGSEPMTFGVDEVAPFAPIPDPSANYRGMSWLTPVIREIKADGAATQHKLQFFESAATPQSVVKFEPGFDPVKVREFIEIFEQNHSGVLNAYRTAYLGGGADLQVVGSNLRQMDFKNTQGAGESRIAAAAGVHPTIVGLSEGLQGASLNAGNFGAARRLTADKTLRPLWRNMAGSLETIIPTPAGSRLWYDDRDVAFLSEDVKDAAEVLSLEASAIRTLGDGGWVPDSVVEAVTSGDLRRLQATGYLPVQLQTVRPEAEPEQEAARLMAPAVSALLPSVASGEVRCPACSKLLAEMATAPYRFTCTNTKCRTVFGEGGTSLPQNDALVAALERITTPQVNVTIAEGAIQVHSPVTIERGAEERSSMTTIERDEETGVVRIGRSA